MCFRGKYLPIGDHLVRAEVMPERLGECLELIDEYTRETYAAVYDYRVWVMAPGVEVMTYAGPVLATVEKIQHNLFKGREWTVKTMHDNYAVLIAHEVVRHLSLINEGQDADRFHLREDREEDERKLALRLRGAGL